MLTTLWSIEQQRASATDILRNGGLWETATAPHCVIFRRRLHQLIGRNGCCAASS